MLVLSAIKKEFQNSNTRPWQLGVLVALALGCSFLFSFGFPKVPLFMVGGLLGLLVIYYCLAAPLIGFYLVTAIAYFVAYPERIFKTPIPLSTGIEVLVLLLFLGTSRITKSTKPVALYKTPVSAAFLFYILFILIELFNPHMYSVAGWLFFVRRLLMFLLIYVVSYRLFDDLKKIKTFFLLWFSLAFLAAVYACFQQWFGFLPFEMDYLMSNPHEYKLYFQGGTIRKFSFLVDPATFGVLAGYCSVFILVLAINEKRTRIRNLFFFVFLVLMIGMAYTGTRTTNIMLPAGLALYGLLTITHKTTLITLFLFIITSAFILFGPIENNTINRIRSTFNTKEESLAVRDMNRKYIQPYIYSHPIGGGIFTSGLLGEKYNPGHPLAGFPPDSGFVLAAIELGWVGYALTILVYFLMLYQGVHFYFQTTKREHKLYIAALTASLFSIILTQYAQVTIGQLPTALFFYSALSLITRLKELGRAPKTSFSKQ